LRQFRDNFVQIASFRKVQHPPIDGNLPRADAEESAEIDDGGPYLPGMVNHDVDNAPHVITIGALDRFTEDRIGHIAVNNDGRHAGICGLSRRGLRRGRLRRRRLRGRRLSGRRLGGGGLGRCRLGWRRLGCGGLRNRLAGSRCRRTGGRSRRCRGLCRGGSRCRLGRHRRLRGRR
jgi:hypothetical protein